MSRRYIIECDLHLKVEVSADSRAQARAAAEQWSLFLAWCGASSLAEYEGSVPDPPESVVGFLLGRSSGDRLIPDDVSVFPGRLDYPAGVLRETLAAFPECQDYLEPDEVTHKRACCRGCRGWRMPLQGSGLHRLDLAGFAEDRQPTA